MTIGLVLTLSDPAQPGSSTELLVRFGLSVVGVAAWGVDRLWPLAFRGVNVVRVLLGAALGLALGLMLGRHVVEPFRPDVVHQIVLVTLLGAGFLAVDLLRRRAVRKGRDCEETEPRDGAVGAP